MSKDKGLIFIIFFQLWGFNNFLLNQSGGAMKNSSKYQRMLMCMTCGAPVPAAAEAGTFTCTYCGAALRARAKRTGPIRFPADDMGIAPEKAEQARLVSLRKQAEHDDGSSPYAYNNVPKGLEYIHEMSSGDEAFLPAALSAFRMAVDRCESSNCAFNDQQAVFWLASQMRSACIQQGKPERAQAALANAYDLLEDPGFLQMTACVLAMTYLRGGDLASAEEQLGACEPRPALLEVDTEYRWSRGTLYLAQGKWEEALDIVGDEHGDIPYEGSAVFTFNSVRVAALERLGRADDAEEEMRNLLEIAESEYDADHQLLAKMYRGMKHWEPAAEVLKRVIE
ncbi:MAG TPA: tetratricopeptide repeat protein [Spirochaetota bacterium]|nr:tetratricopeptide repeat protein [Spirochaetota bacterium]